MQNPTVLHRTSADPTVRRRLSRFAMIGVLGALASGAVPAFAQPASAPAAPASAPASQPATKPVPADGKRIAAEDPAQPNPKWLTDGYIEGRFMSKHLSFLERAKESPVDLLFLGDSITEGWLSRGSDVFKAHFGKYATGNFGISGDRTQHVLWRIANGELDTIKPKVVVLMIGTNNSNLPADEIARGTTAVVKNIEYKLPETKILLLGIFPRGIDANDPMRLKMADANKILAKLDDGQHVFYQDIASAFLAPDGTLPDFGDHLHPNTAGYEKWAGAIQEKVDALMK